jgi:hypothetical protein
MGFVKSGSCEPPSVRQRSPSPLPRTLASIGKYHRSVTADCMDINPPRNKKLMADGLHLRSLRPGIGAQTEPEEVEEDAEDG